MLCLPPTGAEWAQGSERRACIHLGECCKLTLMHTNAAHRLISLPRQFSCLQYQNIAKTLLFHFHYSHFLLGWTNLLVPASFPP